MKKVLVTAMALAASGAFSSSLDLQPGQMSFEVDLSDAGSSGSQYSYKNDAISYESSESNRRFFIDVTGRKAYSEKVTLGSGLYIATFSNKTNETNVGKTKETDFRYGVSPFIEYQLASNLELYGKLDYYYSAPGTFTDLDGTESPASWDYRSSKLETGVIYKRDLNAKTLLDVRGGVGLEVTHSEDSEDATNYWTDVYYLLTFDAGIKHFLADNFSANAGLYMDRSSWAGSENSGTITELGDGESSVSGNSGIAVGFTYYFR